MSKCIDIMCLARCHQLNYKWLCVAEYIYYWSLINDEQFSHRFQMTWMKNETQIFISAFLSICSTYTWCNFDAWKMICKINSLICSIDITISGVALSTATTTKSNDKTELKMSRYGGENVRRWSGRDMMKSHLFYLSYCKIFVSFVRTDSVGISFNQILSMATISSLSSSSSL